ncbi:MAG: AMP-binding protein [Planctomycetes bacterium]|nr:AMP-binding protein [Planctomycetota bacterium]
MDTAPVSQDPPPLRRPLRETYAGKRILLTGAAGFLGKVYLSALLRYCPEVGQIIVIIRADNEQALQDRFVRDIVTSPALDPLRDVHGMGLLEFLRAKITVLRGDLAQPLAGLSADDLRTATEGLDLVVHCAGLVDFVPPLDKALSANVDGTLHTLELARRAGEGRAAFLHVSTCFVCGLKPGVHPEDLDLREFPNRKQASFEGFDATVELEHARRIVTRLKTEEGLDPRVQAELWDEADGSPRRAKRLADTRVKRRLIEAGLERAEAWGWPNTYTYTKALAERLVAAAGGIGPATIVRPAVVESALRYPFPGWNQGINTSAPLVWMNANGQRYWPTTDDFFLDVIPVDLVCNALVTIGAAALDHSPARPLKKVYQLGTSDKNPFAMRRVVELASLVYSKKPVPAENMVSAFLRRHFEGIGVSQRTYEALGIPTARKVVDGVRGLLDRVPAPTRPRLSSLLDTVRHKVRDVSKDLEKADQIVQIYLPFICNCPVTFRCDNARTLDAELTLEDRATFPFDPQHLDWRHYWTQVHIPGLERWAFPQLRLQQGSGPTGFEPVFPSLTELLEDRARFGRIVLWRRLDAKGEVVARVTYEEALARSKAAAARLVAAGVRPGDRVLLLGENSPEWGLGYFAAQFAGATAVPLESGTEAARVLVLLRASRAKVALLSAAARAAVGEELAGLIAAEGLQARIAGLEEVTAAAGKGEPLPAIPHEHELNPRAPASLIYTSGTTGAPKGVLLSHEAFCRQVRAIASLFPIGGDDRVLSVLPLHHGFEFSAGFLLPLYGGATVTYLHETTADAVRVGLDVVKPTAMIGVPALFDAWQRKVRRQVRARGANAERAYEALLAFHRGLRARTGLNLGARLFPEVHAAFGGALRFVVSGGAALSREIALEFDGLGIDIFEGYGMTEAGPVITANRPGELRVLGSVGQPIPEVEVKVRDPDGEGVGEVLCRSPSLFTAYDQDPELTARTLVDGWLHTGDLGRLDEHGHLHIVGRLKDAIVDASGNTVHPDEVEDLYAGCPDVAELAVAGVALRGDQHEVVAALVVPRADVEGGVEAARERIREFVRVQSEQVPFPKRVKVLQFTTRTLPRTPTRKVKRAEVARMLAEMSRAGERAAPTRRARRPGARGWNVGQAFEEVAGVEASRVVPEANLSQDLGLDSIALAEVALALAEQFGKAAPPSLVGVATVADLLALFDHEGGARGPTSAEPIQAEPRPIVLPEPVRRSVSGVLDTLSDWGIRSVLQAKVQGRGHIPHHTNAIVVANHSSHLDVGLVKHALGEWAQELVSAGARDYFFKDTLRATYFENFTNVEPFDRHASVRESLERFVELLRQGKTVLIFPEGTRSTTGRMGSFKPGVGLLVQAARVGILPVYLSGTYQAMPKGTFLPRRRPLEARIGPFLSPDKLLGLTEHLGRRQQALRIVETARAALCALRDGGPFDIDRELQAPVSDARAARRAAREEAAAEPAPAAEPAAERRPPPSRRPPRRSRRRGRRRGAAASRRRGTGATRRRTRLRAATRRARRRAGPAARRPAAPSRPRPDGADGVRSRARGPSGAQRSARERGQLISARLTSRISWHSCSGVRRAVLACR